MDSVETLRDALDSLDGCEVGRSFTVTFVIGLDSKLRIAGRHSEHVACANGKDVLSAGEMTFICNDDQAIIVERVTNQSTGYCPEPESWLSVADALGSIPMVRPDNFEQASVFRRCTACAQINIVKDDWFQCEVCDSPLPELWNFQ